MQIFQILMGGMNFRERSQKNQMSSAVHCKKIVGALTQTFGSFKIVFKAVLQQDDTSAWLI